MAESDETAFRTAVAAIDRGDVDALARLLDRRPALLTATHPDEAGAGAYFESPRLLWFVAENPVRTGRLPSNIVDVVRCIVAASLATRVEDLAEVATYTLALVASGRVARESGLQVSLIDVLVESGADPSGAVAPALAHRELDAARALVDRGAPVDLEVAAALGKHDAVRAQLADSDQAARHRALCLAATNGQAGSIALIAAGGVDPNRFAPPTLGEHATPLHHAVASDAAEAVRALLAAGADASIRDRRFDSDALGWARHFGHAEIEAILTAHRTSSA